jgi:adenine-specific DNA-methyltransferase
MRYLGNKQKLTGFIENVIEKHNIQGEVFADLFSGTCSVGDYFKGKYKIIANDYMYYSKVISDAKILNNTLPGFKKFITEFKVNPFEYLNNKKYIPSKDYFVFQNYSPVGNRMYINESNAIKIDGMRLDIEDFYKDGLVEYNEYVFLLASLLGAALKISNTSGTYQAFFKFWESRSKNVLVIEPIEINNTISVNKNNIAFNENINQLVRNISGDIAYLDPPYTITQYTNSYHVLETIARYDYPELFGKTGRRKKRELSNYSNKTNALIEFEDLLRQIDFEHILISYSNQSIIKIDDLVNLIRIFARDNEVHIEECEYREYATNNLSHKGDNDRLKEVIIYFKKNCDINKSPLNYSGSKDHVLPKIIKSLPKHVGTFVDAMGGALNVGANITAVQKVIYNEFNPFVFEIMKMFNSNEPNVMISKVNSIINEYNLSKKAKNQYLALRENYNSVDKSPIKLYVLQIYAFQNMIRFNAQLEMNTPVGNNEFSEGIEERILCFQPRTPLLEYSLGSYKDISLSNLPKDTVFYFDPPYFITKAEYNDGKRGLEGWNAEKEVELLNYLYELDLKGYKFMLSNVLFHNGNSHHILNEWVKNHNFNIIEIGETGIKYPRKEVLITNYN